MADRKITELSAMSAGGQATGDLVTIVDVSEAAAADKNKKMTMENLFKGIPGDVGIGTSTPSSYGGAVKLAAVSSSNTAISIASGTSDDGTLFFADGTSGDATYRGSVKYSHQTNSMQFSTAASEQMRINSSGNVGIGTSSPNEKLVVSGNASVTGAVQLTSNTSAPTAGAFLFRPAANTLAFGSNSAERLRIDDGGRVLIGTDTQRTIGGHAAALQVSGTNFSTSTINITNNANSGNGAYLFFSRQRSGSAGGNTILQNNDMVGQIRWLGADGNDVDSSLAKVDVFVDGTPGSNDMPGRMVFSTTADGASSPTERMRIDSSGRVGINASSPARTLDVNGVIRSDGTSGGFELGANSSTPSVGCAIHRPANNTMAFVTGTNERMRIDSSGNIGINTTNLTARLTLNGTLRFQTGNNPIALLTGDGDGTNCFKFDSNSAVGNGSGLVRVFNNGTQKARIEGDGSFQSAANSYGALSDISLKENIVDANPQWADIKNIQVRNFNFKEAVGHGTSTHLGVIAQEVESVSPGLVKTDSDGVKSVKYSVLYMKAVKALQEAMDRIETLEAKVAALEAQ